MSSLPLMRTEYWNLSTNTVRGGATAHGESLTDVESYLLPHAQVSTSSLHIWGVAGGLAVSATPQQIGVTVSPGVALDAAGHLIAVAVDGFVVIDATVDPHQVANIPTVPVTVGGVVLDTADLSGELFLTLTWREVLGQSQLANAPVLIHAPWLRLLATSDVDDTGGQVILAKVSLDDNGLVTALSADRRRLVGAPAARLELRHPFASVGPPLAVDHRATAELSPLDDGGLAISLLPATGPSHSVLAVDGSATTLSLLPAGGNVGIGLGGNPPQRTLHVEGLEIHSGGPTGGYSFANRTTASFVNQPSAGERWVWYAQDGSARLWSGGDRLSVSLTTEGGGLDVARRMRVRQENDASAGIWFFQTAAQADRAFVGMADDDNVGFWGNQFGWGLRMDISTANLVFGGDYGRPDGPSTLSLFGSRIGDVGGGVLFIRSGGGVVAFDGADRVGIGTTSPDHQLDVVSSGTAIAGHGGDGFLVSGVYGEAGTAMFANGRNTGIIASGSNTGVLGMSKGLAGQFFGNVHVTGTLSKGGGGFKIDHPLDPANRYLSHSFVESPEMLNLYRGTVTTDERGEATIDLPDYFATLNRDYSYHLTVIGAPALAAVTREIEDNRFTVTTDRPEVTVSWLVIGSRQDAWAKAHPLVVEEDKSEQEREFYLHPEAHALPATRGLAHAHYPDVVQATADRDTPPAAATAARATKRSPAKKAGRSRST
jgi:hypothetical protein